MVVAVTFVGCHAAGFDRIFKEFKHAANVEYVSVPSWLLKLGSIGTDDSDDMPGKVSGVKVLDLEKCGSDVKKRLFSRVEELSGGYEEAVEITRGAGTQAIEPVCLLKGVNDEGEKVRMWIVGDEKKISKLYIFALDDSDCAFIELKGEFSYDKLDELASINYN